MQKKLKIKVCGLRDEKDILKLSLMDIDFMGFIFYKPSPRYAGEMLKPERIENIPERIIKTGVFVNEKAEDTIRIAQKYHLQAIQLHGNESTDLCNELKEKGYIVIKALKGNKEDLVTSSILYKEVCDYYLIDTPTVQHGGSGQKFNWSILNEFEFNKPFFLSGGIGPHDTDIINSLNFRDLYAVDINSKFETSPGKKDTTIISEFIKKIK
ncbi:MAG TPA: phosphoribosylanthranilate isomerase [Bacteroidales bacterium]|nr:phosphoribosylanthranilate isomerase [Bacteroidales bacterium]